MSRYRSDPPDLIDKLKELEERIKRLESSPRIGNTSIDDGTLLVNNGQILITNGQLVVRDNLGNDRIHLGLLTDGSYDLEVINSANESVKLASLAFGERHLFDTTNCATTSGTYADPNVSGTAGPAVTVTIGESRRARVTFGGLITTGFGAPKVQNGGNISVEISGASTLAASDDWAAGNYHQLQITAGNGPALDQMVTPPTRVYFFGPEHGLNPGLNTFTLKYKCSGGGGQQADFADRLILVEPF